MAGNHHVRRRGYGASARISNPSVSSASRHSLGIVRSNIGDSFIDFTKLLLKCLDQGPIIGRRGHLDLRRSPQNLELALDVEASVDEFLPKRFCCFRHHMFVIPQRIPQSMMSGVAAINHDVRLLHRNREINCWWTVQARAYDSTRRRARLPRRRYDRRYLSPKDRPLTYARKIVLHCPSGYSSRLDELVEEFMAYVGVAGKDCARIEEIIDELVVGDGSDEGRFILTCSHESLEEALAFASSLNDEYSGEVEVVRL
jgi:hypothetical protein